MENLYNQRIIDITNVFDDQFLEAKMLYLHCFNTLPSLNYIGQINGEKVFKAFREKFGSRILATHQYRWYRVKKKKYQFDRTLVILDNKCLLEFDESYCEIYHNGTDEHFIEQVTELGYRFRERERRQPLEINLIVQGHRGLQLRSMEIKRTKLDLDLYYEDDFKEVDCLVRKRLGQKDDKGIVLLHGLPGTGKTTYLRYLVGKIRKRILFLSPSVADNLMNPDFIELLTNNPNTVLIIEDAENIIMDRKQNSGSSVSNLLNISDGLLADFLNVQLICTFNSSVTAVDSALLRKGRLIARYEFGKLSVAKAERLSAHLGFKTTIDKPMTIAEITNPDEKEGQFARTEVIGFRMPETLMN